MNKVYLVTSGEYSSYSVNAVFATRELAEGYLGVLAANAKASTDEELSKQIIVAANYLEYLDGKHPRPDLAPREAVECLARLTELRDGRARPGWVTVETGAEVVRMATHSDMIQTIPFDPRFVRQRSVDEEAGAQIAELRLELNRRIESMREDLASPARETHDYDIEEYDLWDTVPAVELDDEGDVLPREASKPTTFRDVFSGLADR